MTLEKERLHWEQEASKEPLPPNICSRKENISGVNCLWVSDENSKNERALLYLHGGGLISGSATTHLNFAARVAELTGLSVLLVNYRLLPEHEYPAPLDDALTVYHALISSQVFSHNQVVIGGDSSGGGLVLAMLVQLKESGTQLPSCAFAVSGTFDMTLSGQSMQTNSGLDPMLSFDELKEWQEKYLSFDLTSPILSPMYADLSGLPPISLIAGGKELWLSDSQRVAEKIKRENGRVEYRVWESMGHVWVMDSELKESNEALIEINNFVSKY